MMKSKYFVNENIKENKLRVIDPNGNFIGDLNRNDALEMAKNMNLDLVLINSKNDPPIAKMMNFSKFRYEMEKKEKDLKKKKNTVIVKEINLRVNTSDWDLKRIQKRIIEWLDEGKKVKVNLLMKGREYNHKNNAIEFFRNFISEIEGCKIENDVIKESSKGLFSILTSNHSQKNEKKKNLQ